ncbi:MAG: electron transfer flavoprotein beta subunit/FixA family protein [Acidobacteria bacterium]|nr:MAG: electron transfer flavoprotein beta subunit/FixA family protein [Acidobacteriota bacterium]
MKILVCLKQVPAKDAPLKLAPDATWIREDVSYEVNEPDAFALEAALRLKEAHGGEVVALTVGPARAAQILREALAKGADRAVHVEGSAHLDAYAAAEAITRAIAGESFDLICTGLQSDDDGFGQTGVIIAELLGAPHATIIMQIEPAGEKRIKVKRELEGGNFQFVEMPTPAVLSIQSGINKLRYATLMGIKQAKNKPMAHTTLEEVGVAPSLNRQVLHKLFLPVKSKGTTRIEGNPKEQAAALLQHLRQDAHVL